MLSGLESFNILAVSHLVDVEIEHEHAAHSSPPQQLHGSHSQVIKDAEAAAVGRESMVGSPRGVHRQPMLQRQLRGQQRACVALFAQVIGLPFCLCGVMVKQQLWLSECWQLCLFPISSKVYDLAITEICILNSTSSGTSTQVDLPPRSVSSKLRHLRAATGGDRYLL